MSPVIKGGMIYKSRGAEGGNVSGIFAESGIAGDSAKGGFVSNNELVIAGEAGSDNRVIDIGNSFILPGFCDVHVHFREPGQEYKETIATGSMAAARGGYTTVCTMPNTVPAPDSMETLEANLGPIRRDAVIQVVPFGAITEHRAGHGRPADMRAMAPYVAGFSDDGTGVQTEDDMRAAMELAAELGKIISAHCEDLELLADGKVRESEWRQIERDLELAYKTGVSYHVCHISCTESVSLIRDAKKSGVDVTCETAPHYLLLDTRMRDAAIAADETIGGRYKVNPPIKDPADREALIEGALDGTIDMIATDHAPHSDEEKSRGFKASLNGFSGIECAFPVLYTGLVRTGIMPFDRLLEMLTAAPRARFGFEDNGYSVWNLEDEYEIHGADFLSRGKWTPFEGMKVYGRNLLTVCDGQIVYEKPDRLQEF